MSCDHENISVPVFDERPHLQREYTLPPEVDMDVCQTLKDELLFEQYGGPVADDAFDGIQDPQQDDEPSAPDQNVEGLSGKPDSYSVPTFELARQHFKVLDNWSCRVRIAHDHADPEELRTLRWDGDMLMNAFRRRAARDAKISSANAIGAQLAAEEMALRLNHLAGI